MATEPFFLVGSPRSGTTLLRNVLRTHPGLVAPEETHFYRWSSAFKSYFYRSQYETELLVRHRQLDGISDEHFWAMFDAAATRRELQDAYMEAVVAATKPGARWFDKTPQNSFGVLHLSADYPDAAIVHLVRHPLPVVASVLRGDAITATSLDEAIAHWREPVQTLIALQALRPAHVLTLRYGDITNDLGAALHTLGAHAQLDVSPIAPAAFDLRSDERDWTDVIDRETESIVRHRCQAETEALGLDAQL